MNPGSSCALLVTTMGAGEKDFGPHKKWVSKGIRAYMLSLKDGQKRKIFGQPSWTAWCMAAKM